MSDNLNNNLKNNEIYKLDFVDIYGFLTERNTELFHQEILCKKSIEEKQNQLDFQTLEKLKEKMFYKGTKWNKEKSKKDNFAKKEKLKKDFEEEILNIINLANLNDSILLIDNEIVFIKDNQNIFEQDLNALLFSYGDSSDEPVTEFEKLTGLLNERDFILTPLKELTIKDDKFCYTNIYDKHFVSSINDNEITTIKNNQQEFDSFDGEALSEECRNILNDLDSANKKHDLFNFVEVLECEKSKEFEDNFGFKIENVFCDIFGFDKQLIKNKDIKNTQEYELKIPFFGKTKIKFILLPDESKTKNNFIRFLIGKNNDKRLLERELIQEFNQQKELIKNDSFFKNIMFENLSEKFISILLKLKRFNKEEISKFLFKMKNQTKDTKTLFDEFIKNDKRESIAKIVDSNKIKFVEGKLYCKVDGSWELLNEDNQKDVFCDIFLEGKNSPEFTNGNNWKKVEGAFNEQLAIITKKIDKKDKFMVDSLVEKPNCWALSDNTTFFFDINHDKWLNKNVSICYKNIFPFTKEQLKENFNEENKIKIFQLINHLTENDLSSKQLNKKGQTLLNALTVPLLFDELSFKKANVAMNLISTPGTGKTTLINLFRNAIGLSNVGQSNEFDIHEQKIHELSTSSAIIFDDIKNDSNKIRGNEINGIKSLIDGLPLTEKTLYKQKRNIIINSMPFILSNFVLDYNKAPSMWRRTILLNLTDNKIQNSDLLASFEDYNSNELACCLLAMLLENAAKIIKNINGKNRSETLMELYSFDDEKADRLHLKYSYKEYNNIEEDSVVKDIVYDNTIQCILDEFGLDYVEQLSFIKFPTLYNRLIGLGYKLTKPQLKAKLDEAGMKVNNMSTRKNNKNVTSAILPKNNELKNKLLEIIQENLRIDLFLFDNSQIESVYNIEIVKEIKDKLKEALL